MLIDLINLLYAHKVADNVNLNMSDSDVSIIQISDFKVLSCVNLF